MPFMGADLKKAKIKKKLNILRLVGCMLAGGEYYAYSCHPADVWASINKNRENIMFIDVQARGYYPNYALKMFEHEYWYYHRR